MPASIIAAIIAVYANSLGGAWVFDDYAAVVENPSIRRLWPPGDVLAPPRDTPVAGRPLTNLLLEWAQRAGRQSAGEDPRR